MSHWKHLFYICLFTAHCAYGNQANPDIPRLTVRGQASIKRPADQVSLSIGVVTEAKDAQAALRENSTKMQGVIEVLSALGLESNEYETGRFQINPRYNARPKNPEVEWSPSIIGYNVTNTLQIRTSKLKKVGEVIDAVSQAGANTVSDIRFSLKDPQQWRQDAIKAAAENAMNEAKILADAANATLAKLLFVSLDQQQGGVPQTMKSTPYMARMESPPPIEGGDIDITATVNIVYEMGRAKQ